MIERMIGWGNTLDLEILKIMHAARNFMYAWCSVTNRQLETVVMAVWLISAGHLMIEDDPLMKFVWGLTIIVCLPIMWQDRKCTDTHRVIKLLSPQWIALRVLTCFSVAMSLFVLKIAPGYFAQSLSLMVYLYLTSLPLNTGERGGKRKVAIGELRKMFGSSWIPQHV